MILHKHLADQVIAALIIDAEQGTLPLQKKPWPTFYSQMPPVPDDAISVLDVSHPTEGYLGRLGTQVRMGFQVIVRGKLADPLKTKVIELWHMLEKTRNYELSVDEERYRIGSITHLMTPTYMGADPQGRLLYSLNCTTTYCEV